MRLQSSSSKDEKEGARWKASGKKVMGPKMGRWSWKDNAEREVA